MAIKYIDSTSKNFYKSELPEKGPDGQTTWLKRKYRIGGSAPHYNRHSDNNNAARKRKPPNSDNPPPKVMIMENAQRGHTVMMTQANFVVTYGFTPGFTD